jgi:hypothetical protein
MSLERRASRTGPTWVGRAVLRMVGILTVFVMLALPKGEAAASAPAGRVLDRELALGGSELHADEDGACEEIEPQELLECGAQYDDMLDQPLVLSLLRTLGIRLTADTCSELLSDLWAQQICEVGSIDCGKMNAGAPPGPPSKLLAGSASGHSSWATSGVPDTSSTRLALGDRTRAFDSRDLQPPVPPPRCSGH